MAEISFNMGIPKKANISKVSTDTVITHDVSEEFSLPDYVPEVRRVLTTRAQVLPESKYISDGGAGSMLELGGTVTYSVIYTDDEGKLCSTPLSSNYETQTVLNSHPDTVFIDTVADNVSCRVNAPRKLTIKTRLKSRILAFEGNEIDENIEGKSGEDEFFIERMCENVNSVGIKTSSLQNIHISDRFDTGSVTDIQPIWCDASMDITDVKAHNGAISVRGDVYVKCLCNTSSGIMTLNKTVPLSEEMETDGAETGDMSRATGRCVSLSISSEQSDGEDRLFFDVNCELEGELYRNEENIMTKDCYSTKYETDSTYRNIDTYSAVKCINSSFTSSESVKRKNKDISEIVEIITDPVYEKTEIKGQKAIIYGKLYITVIGKSAPKGDIEGEFISEEYEIPFKYETDISRSSEDILTRADFSTGNVSARYDAEKFYCTAEIFPSVSIFSKGNAKILDTATLKKDKEIKKDSSCIRVYFPKNGDTLWEIAKKYHISSKKIAERNNITTASLDGVKDIII
ncbi:MAG: SPOCS domain-containing protein [Eubacteriales bacterium]